MPHEILQSVIPINDQALKDPQDSNPDPIHFIETGLQVKKVTSTERKKEDTAFLIIQKIHNQLKDIQWDLQRLHSLQILQILILQSQGKYSN